MSWNTSFLVQKTHRGKGKEHFFATLGLPGGEVVSRISFDQAGSLSLPGKAVGVVGEWTIVVDPVMFSEVANQFSETEPSLFPVVIESRLVGDGGREPAFGFLCYGTSSTYGFAEYSGVNTRRVVLVQEDKTVYDVGEAKYEHDRFTVGEDGEDLIFGLILEITGLSWDEIMEAEFFLVRFDPDHIAWVHQ